MPLVTIADIRVSVLHETSTPRGCEADKYTARSLAYVPDSNHGSRQHPGAAYYTKYQILGCVTVRRTH